MSLNFMSKKLISLIILFPFLLTAIGPNYLFALRPPNLSSAKNISNTSVKNALIGPKTVEPAQIPPLKEQLVVKKESPELRQLSEEGLEDYLAEFLLTVQEREKIVTLKDLIKKPELPEAVKNRLGDETTLKRLEKHKNKIAEILSRWEEELRKKNFKDDEIERLLDCGLLPGYISENRLSKREALQLAKQPTIHRRTEVYKEIVKELSWPRTFALQLALKKPVRWREAPSIYQDIKKYMPDFPEDEVIELVIYSFRSWREGAKERLVREVLKAQDRRELIAILNKYGNLELFVGMISRLPSEIAKELSNKKDAEIKDLILEINKIKVSSNKVIARLIFFAFRSPSIDPPSLGPERSFYKNSAEIETIDWKGFDETGFKIALEKMLRTVISYDLLGTNPLIVYLASKKLEELNEEQLNIAIPVLKQSGLAESKKRLNEIIAYNKKLSAIEYLVKEGLTREELQEKNLEGLFGLTDKMIKLKTRDSKKPAPTKISKILAGLAILFFTLPESESSYFKFLKPVWPEKGLVKENNDKISQELAVIDELFGKFTSKEKERIIRRLFALTKTEKDQVVIHKAIYLLLKVIPLTMERREVPAPEMEELFGLLEENVDKPVDYLPYPETDLTDIMGFEPLVYKLLEENKWAYIDRLINILNKIFKQRQLSGRTYFYWGRENWVIPFSLMRLALLIGDKDIQRCKSIDRIARDWSEYATLRSGAIQTDSNIGDILYEGIDRLPRSLSNLLNEFEKLVSELPENNNVQSMVTTDELIGESNRKLSEIRPMSKELKRWKLKVFWQAI